MTYETSTKMLESGTRKFTKTLLVSPSVHFLVILVCTYFSCSSDHLVEIMAIDPELKFNICIGDTRPDRD